MQTFRNGADILIVHIVRRKQCSDWYIEKLSQSLNGFKVRFSPFRFSCGNTALGSSESLRKFSLRKTPLNPEIPQVIAKLHIYNTSFAGNDNTERTKKSTLS